MIALADHQGSPYIGVYCCASNAYAFVPTQFSEELVISIEEALGVKVVRTLIGGTSLVGSLMAMNSKGAVVSDLAMQSELDAFPQELEVAKMEEKLNAAGNNILVTDKAAIVHPGVSKETLRALADVLGVEVSRGTIAGIATVGSAAIATEKGILCHPRATEQDIASLKSLFKTQVTLATLNYGTPWIGACAVANAKGAVVGNKTTPIEMGKLEDGLDLL